MDKSKSKLIAKICLLVKRKHWQAIVHQTINQDTQSALNNFNTTAWDSWRNFTIQDNNRKDVLKF